MDEGRLWHHEGREIRIRPARLNAEGEAEEFAHFRCACCYAEWVDVVDPDLRALEQLYDCPADLDRDRAAPSTSGICGICTLTPEEVLASGQFAIPLEESERQALIRRWLRSPEAVEALTEWGCDHVYRIDGTWPQAQIQASLRLAADALEAKGQS